MPVLSRGNPGSDRPRDACAGAQPVFDPCGKNAVLTLGR